MFKIVTAGEGAVGKTTFLQKYTTGKFIQNLKQTIGVEFFSNILERDGKLYQIVIWDFGGQDHFRTLLSSYIDGTAGALFMFDITDIHRSLKNIDEWWSTLNKGREIPILLIATKNDLFEETHFNKFKDQIDNALEKYHFIDYKKTSSKTGLNIGECIDILLDKLIEIYNKLK